MPERIRLSRKRGYTLPPNAVVVCRPGPWGNPFRVGTHGTRAECVELHIQLMGGLLTISLRNVDEQQRCFEHARAHIAELRGRDLACWCSIDGPCHADTLLEIANATTKPIKGEPEKLWPRRCRECGCTDLRACDGGCWWVEGDLCSSCNKAEGCDHG